jgi:predicted metal-dependent peptidase
MKTKFEGRGGTLIEPVIDWANQNKPQLLLVFTDGFFRFNDAKTKINTVWLIHGNERFHAPYGKTIHYLA